MVTLLEPRRRRCCVHNGCALRARDWLEVGQARMRRKLEHNAIVLACQSGTLFTSIGVEFARNPATCSTKCSVRATNCSSPRGALGAIGPEIAMIPFNS